jgi:hypothetical protein
MDSNHNIPDGLCTCTICGIEQPNTEFPYYLDRKTKDGFRLRTNKNCRTCRGKKSPELDKLKKIHTRPPFGQPCDCCGKPVYENWQLDHCHDSGEFRGWLCKQCNTGLGSLGDTFDSIFKCAVYLQKREKINPFKKLLCRIAIHLLK